VPLRVVADSGKAAAEAGRGRSVEGYLLSAIEVPLALALAVAVMMAVAWLACSTSRYRCVDISGLPWYLGGAVLGLVVAVIYWRKSFRLGNQLRRRFVLDAIVVALSVAPYVIAWTSDWMAAHRALTDRQPAAPKITK
jgi:hypothetical protein